jgi:hypothetical protein
MKKLVYFSFVLAICFFSSCKDDPDFIAKESLITKEKSNIDLFEEKNGAAVKVEKTFKDSNSGSYVKILFASKSQNNLDQFFKTNSIEFDGLSTEDILEIKTAVAKRNNLKKISTSENTSKSDNVSDSFIEESVVFDLVEKKLLKEDKGFSFKIRQISNLTNQNKSARVTVDWRQQTSLEWCEALSIHWNNVSYPYPSFHKSAYVYSQQRGWFWNGSGAPIGIISDNGSIWDLWIDGPKFTRIGGEGNFSAIVNYVVWYDYESGQTANG